MLRDLKIICKECGKSFYSKYPNRKFCSTTCSSKGRTMLPNAGQFKKGVGCGKVGDKHPSWRGGIKINRTGHVSVYSPTHPNRDKQGFYKEHRLVMEEHLGRYLLKHEIIHHKNGEPYDNRIENLQLFNCQSDHLKFHHKCRGMGQYDNDGM